MSAVRKAVLLAAGRGSRLGFLTERFPKPMLEVGGIPILHRIIDGLASAGVSQITVVTGHCAEQLEAGTGDGSRWRVRIEYIRQPTPDGTARAVALARSTVRDEPFFAGWGDIIVEPANYARVIEAAGANDAALAVNAVDDPNEGGAVYFDEASRITRLVEKPPKGTSTTGWNNSGLFVLPPSIWSYIDKLEESPRGEYELPQAIASFIAAGNAMTAVPIRGPWFDIGTPANLEAARAHFRHRVAP